MPIQQGTYYKAAKIAGNPLKEEDMLLINKYALSPIAPEEIFSFKVTMCGNDIDRDYEVFTFDTLKTLSELFVGKTVVKDHEHKSDNQIARIYATDLLVDANSITKAGESYTQLIAKCYMVKTSSNADLIAEIQAGIRKEVSLGCRISKAICSVCGTDNSDSYCKHFPGQNYDGHTCFFKLEGATDAYELSFVAVAAQREAGTTKSYGTKPIHIKDFEEKEVLAPEIEEQPIQTDETGEVKEEPTANELPTIEPILCTKCAQEITKSENTPEIEADIADFTDVIELAEQLEEVGPQTEEQTNVGVVQNPTLDIPTSVKEKPQTSEGEQMPLVSNETQNNEQKSDDIEPNEAQTETSDTQIEINESQDQAVCSAVESDSPEKAISDKEKLAAARLRALDMRFSLLKKA